MLQQQAAETCRVGTFYLTEMRGCVPGHQLFSWSRRHKAVLRASAGSEELLTRPTSVRASRSRSKHPPTHARVRWSAGKSPPRTSSARFEYLGDQHEKKPASASVASWSSPPPPITSRILW